MKVLNGIDRLAEYGHIFNNGRLGLITSPCGVSIQLESAMDILNRKFNLKALYSPEHGARGDMAAGDPVDTYTDERSGLPVFSLYGANKRPSAEMLDGIDMLLVDVQDIGSRYYTYISTMRNCMEACAEYGKSFAVLDRPNPIGGLEAEGNCMEEKFLSFVGAAPIPQRHGLTMGELAVLFNEEYKINCELTIIPVSGWDRAMYFQDTGLPWVNPSPNMPCADAALLYPGTCLFEGTNLSEGRGTTRPFEFIGAPWLDAETLADELNNKNLPGLRFRPVYFRPSFSKHQNVLCRGVQAHITDRRRIKPLRAGLSMLETVRRLSGDTFNWLPPWTKGGAHFIDLLLGSQTVREENDTEKYLDECIAGEESFAAVRQKYLLY